MWKPNRVAYLKLYLKVYVVGGVAQALRERNQLQQPTDAPPAATPPGTPARAAPEAAGAPGEAGVTSTDDWVSNKGARKAMAEKLKTAKGSAVRDEIRTLLRETKWHPTAPEDRAAWEAYIAGLGHGGQPGEHDPQLAFTIAAAAFSSSMHQHGALDEFRSWADIARRIRSWRARVQSEGVAAAVHSIYRRTQHTSHAITAGAPTHWVSAFLVRQHQNEPAEVLLTYGAPSAGHLEKKWATPTRAIEWGGTTRETATTALWEDAGTIVKQSAWQPSWPGNGEPATDPARPNERLLDLVTLARRDQATTTGGNIIGCKWHTVLEIAGLDEANTCHMLHARAMAAVDTIRAQQLRDAAQPAPGASSQELDALFQQYDAEEAAETAFPDDTPTGGARDPLIGLDYDSDDQSDEESPDEDPDDDLEETEGPQTEAPAGGESEGCMVGH